MSTIVLIRPGCTDFDEQHRVQGSLDLPLNGRGELQVREIVRQLQDIDLDILYSSPCNPASATAHQISDALDIPLRKTEFLCNLNQGLWEGLETNEVRKKNPKVMKQWEEAPERICPPQGEQVSAALKRIEKAIRKPIRKNLSFAVIASEPLATLVSYYVRGEWDEKPYPMSDAFSHPLVECLKQGSGSVTNSVTVGSSDTDPITNSARSAS